jgi:hypothetical protein
MLQKMFTYAITNRSGAKFKKMERADLHVMFYYYSAYLHLGKAKENFSRSRKNSMLHSFHKTCCRTRFFRALLAAFVVL